VTSGAVSVVTAARGPVGETPPAPATAAAPHTVPSLVASVEAGVEATAQRWKDVGVEPRSVDWSRALVGALQHRVEGLVVDALRHLGWHELAPPSVFHALERRALVAEARFLAHYRALQDLRDRDEELVASLVLINGAALVGDYAMPGHRMVGDVDVLVDDAHADRLAARARELGYWEKDGAAGPTYFKDVDVAVPGAGYVGIDVHDRPPTHRHGGAEAATRHWAGHLVPHVVGDVKVQRATAPLEAAHLLVRLFHHAASWLSWTMEDDVRLIRTLDVELLSGSLGAGDAAEVVAHARALGVTGELAAGLAVLRAVRGRLPAPLASLAPFAAAAEPCTGLLALPTGEVLAVPAALAGRVFDVDKATRARALADDDRRGRDWSRHWRRRAPGDRVALDEIATRADDLVAAAGLVPG
jgi:hypothetical protein